MASGLACRSCLILDKLTTHSSQLSPLTSSWWLFREWKLIFTLAQAKHNYEVKSVAVAATTVKLGLCITDNGVFRSLQSPRRAVPHTDGWICGDFMARSKEHWAWSWKTFILALLLSFCGRPWVYHLSLCSHYFILLWQYPQLDLKMFLS